MGVRRPITQLLQRTLLLALLLRFCSIHSLSAEPGEILWSVGLGFIASFEGSAAIAPDGTIYVTTGAGNHLEALDQDGHRNWSFATASEDKSSPAIGDDGTIYFGSRDRKFYAIAPDGKKKWSFLTGAWVDSSPAVGTDGMIYFGSWDSKFYALDAAGHKLWEFKTDGPIDSSAAIGADATIYFGSHDGCLYALDPKKNKKWAFKTGGPIISSPAIGTDGTVYATSVDGNLYAIAASGAKKWQVHTGGIRCSSPVLDENGAIFVGVNNSIMAVKSDGTPLAPNWGFSVSDTNYPLFIDSSPALSADGILVFGTDYGTLMGFGVATNWPIWTARLVGGIKSSPTIAPDATVFVGSGTHFARVQGTRGLSHSSWPKFRADLRQTGRVHYSQ
jgi:outer membrane protein assembly factor BamB